MERKRHIGNDIVNIVYVESDGNKAPSFKPSMMKTRFTRILYNKTHNLSLMTIPGATSKGQHQTLREKAPSTYWGKIAQGPILTLPIWNITWALTCTNIHKLSEYMLLYSHQRALLKPFLL